MSDLTFYDAAWPPVPPPAADGACCYIGGDAVHVWTAEEIKAQTARYRLPVFVRSDPRGIAGVAADVNAAVAQLKAIGAPKGTLVAWDMETAADKAYIAGVYTGLAAAHGTTPATILRLTAEHSPSAEVPANVATLVDGLVTGTVSHSEPMPAGLALFLPA